MMIKTKSFQILLILIFSLIQASSYTTQADEVRPSGLGYTDMVYDSESDQYILYGGQTIHKNIGSTTGETWAYNADLDVWKSMGVNNELVRTAHAMAYDSESDRIILFSGGGLSSRNFVALEGTWSYDYNTNSWTNLNPSISPPPRYSHQMVYDTESDRIIMFGGVVYDVNLFSNSELFNDTWSYDYNSNSWTQMTPTISPSKRTYSGLAYDIESDRTVLFGGCESVAIDIICPDFPILDTWAYDYNNNSWIAMNPSNEPSGREYHELAYHTNSDQIIMYGGTPYNNETWIYNYNSNEWTELQTENYPPSRDRFAMAYSPNSDAIVVYGGLNPARTKMQADTWSFSYDEVIWSHKAVTSNESNDDVSNSGESSLSDPIINLIAISVVIIIHKKRKGSTKLSK